MKMVRLAATSPYCAPMGVAVMGWTSMLFQNREGIVRTLIVGTLAFGVLILFLRVSGKRTLAKLNAFEFVVTIVPRPILGAILVQESVALAEGAAAPGLLILPQLVVTWASVRPRRFALFMRSKPSLLARSAEFCDKTLKRQRITREEALGAMRQAGGRGIEDVGFLVLQSDGSISAGLEYETGALGEDRLAPLPEQDEQGRKSEHDGLVSFSLKQMGCSPHTCYVPVVTF